MVCYLSFMVSIVFIVGMVYFYSMTYNNKNLQYNKEIFSQDLQKLYARIANERMHISINGYLLGVIFSLLIIFYNIHIKKSSMDAISLVCTVMATCFFTNYFYYTLSPKSDWMLNYVNTREEVDAWLQIYKQMSFNYHMGLVFGIIAMGIFAFSFRC
jgi:hypothetical protein